MNAPIATGYTAPDARTGSVTLPARPEPLHLKPSETAVIVVDIQNAYASPGGYIDIAGFDISGAPAAIANTRTALEAARKAGLTVIFFQNAGTRTMSRPAPPGRRTGTSPTR
jgi:ureidoacrylate peracid hydrolase